MRMKRNKQMDILNRMDLLLLETFDSNIDVKIKKSSKRNSFESIFKINGKDYYFTANYDNNENIWIIDFYLTDKHIDSITGTGDQMKVFSGVIKSMKIFLELHKPKAICYFAIEKSRQRLYDRFTKHIEKMGYIFYDHWDVIYPRFVNVKGKGYFFFRR
jgi:hypothetical protein